MAHVSPTDVVEAEKLLKQVQSWSAQAVEELPKLVGGRNVANWQLVAGIQSTFDHVTNGRHYDRCFEHGGQKRDSTSTGEVA